MAVRAVWRCNEVVDLEPPVTHADMTNGAVFFFKKRDEHEKSETLIHAMPPAVVAHLTEPELPPEQTPSKAITSKTQVQVSVRQVGNRVGVGMAIRAHNDNYSDKAPYNRRP